MYLIINTRILLHYFIYKFLYYKIYKENGFFLVSYTVSHTITDKTEVFPLHFEDGVVHVGALVLEDRHHRTHRLHLREIEHMEHGLLVAVGHHHHSTEHVDEHRMAEHRVIGALHSGATRAEHEHLVLDRPSAHHHLAVLLAHHLRHGHTEQHQIGSHLAIVHSHFTVEHVHVDGHADLHAVHLEHGHRLAGGDVLRLHGHHVELGHPDVHHMHLPVLGQHHAVRSEHDHCVVELVLVVTLRHRSEDQVDLQLLGQFGHHEAGFTGRNGLGETLEQLAFSLGSVEALGQHNGLGRVLLNYFPNVADGSGVVLVLALGHFHLDQSEAEVCIAVEWKRIFSKTHTFIINIHKTLLTLKGLHGTIEGFSRTVLNDGCKKNCDAL